MPLVIARLRKSTAWIKAKRRPELGFYMVNLWIAAWHTVPAASLEDDEDVLADAAMCDLNKWPEVRDEVLRDWVKCSDGRLYHPAVAEKAIESWDAKRAQVKRTSAATAARAVKLREKGHDTRTSIDTTAIVGRRDERGDPRVVERAVERSEERDGVRNDGVTSTNRYGEGEGNGEWNYSAPTGAGGEPPPMPDLVIAVSALNVAGRDLTDDEEKLVWNGALALLVPSYGLGSGNEKTREAKARMFVGGLGKRLKEAGVERRALFDVIQAACAERPVNPETWLSAAVAQRCGTRMKPGAMTDAQRQVANDSANAEALRLLGIGGAASGGEVVDAG
jgi:hypothetical protein